MGKKIISMILIFAFVISFIPFKSYAEEAITAEESKEMSRLISQLKSMKGNELVAALDGYNNCMISYPNIKDDLIHLMHAYDNGKVMSMLVAAYDPSNPNNEITVTFYYYQENGGMITLEATTNITLNDYCSNANSISFDVTGSTLRLSEYNKSQFRKLAASCFQLLISSIRYELATKYKIDLKYCGFRSISSLLQTENSKSDSKNKKTDKKGEWKQDKKGWWYAYSDGSYAKNTWLKIGKGWYYFGANGYMTKNWGKIGGKWYFFGSNGSMRTGWQKIGGKWYYFGTDGAMITGWKIIGNNWYYFNSNGTMQTGWRKSGGSWYYFDKNGVMASGTKTIGGKTYVFSSGGVLQSSDSEGKETVHSNMLKLKNEMIDPSIKEVWGNDFKTEIKNNDLIITLWHPNIADYVALMKNNSSYSTQAWINSRNANLNLAKVLYNGFDVYGIKNANCILNLVSEKDHNVILQSFKNGTLTYDIMQD